MADEPLFNSLPLFGIPPTQSTTDDFYTPRWVFDRMGVTFDLDVAAPPGGVAWIPAARYFTVEDDGLAQPWLGRVWMNPPYSQTTPWVRRFIAHRNGICLVPQAKADWQVKLWEQADALVLPSYYHFTFARRGPGQQQNIRFGVMLAVFGDECVDAIGRLGTVRRIA